MKKPKRLFRLPRVVPEVVVYRLPMPPVAMATMIVIMMRIIMVVIPRAVPPVIGGTVAEINGRPVIRGGIIR